RRGDNWIRHYVRNGRCPSGNHIDSNQLPLSDFRLCTQYGFLDIIPKFLFRWTRNIQCHSNCASHGRTVHCRKGTFKSRAQFGSQNLVHQDEAVKGRTNSEDHVNSPYRLASTWLSFLRSSTGCTALAALVRLRSMISSSPGPVPIKVTGTPVSRSIVEMNSLASL